jgi:cobalamin biosynthesis Co2+ chelatase CbiK
MINWVTFEGRFVTENPNLLVDAINQVLKQTNTHFYGEVYVQQIRDIPCEVVEKTVETIEKTDEEVSD